MTILPDMCHKRAQAHGRAATATIQEFSPCERGGTQKERGGAHKIPKIPLGSVKTAGVRDFLHFWSFKHGFGRFQRGFSRFRLG